MRENTCKPSSHTNIHQHGATIMQHCETYGTSPFPNLERCTHTDAAREISAMINMLLRIHITSNANFTSSA